MREVVWRGEDEGYGSDSEGGKEEGQGMRWLGWEREKVKMREGEVEGWGGRW